MRRRARALRQVGLAGLWQADRGAVLRVLLASGGALAAMMVTTALLATIGFVSDSLGATDVLGGLDYPRLAPCSLRR